MLKASLTTAQVEPLQKVRKQPRELEGKGQRSPVANEGKKSQYADTEGEDMLNMSMREDITHLSLSERGGSVWAIKDSEVKGSKPFYQNWQQYMD